MTSHPFSDPSTHDNDTPRWELADVEALTSNNLTMLFENRIPFIRVVGFATEGECALLASKAMSIGFDRYQDVDPPIDRIGCTVFEYDGLPSDAYFAECANAKAIQRSIFRDSFDPVNRLIDRLRTITNKYVDIAEDADRKYYAGLIRRIEKGTHLHIDFAPVEQSGWSICHVRHQLAWNLYLRVSEDRGGITHVYERQYREGDQLSRSGRYGYDRYVVEGSARASYKPNTGDLMIINTKNFHEVEATRGDRMTVTSALGVTDVGNLVLWS